MHGHAVVYGSTFEGRYELLSRLGEGGFGTVHKARQVTTGQLVALKIMRLPEHGGGSQADIRSARFLREIRLCAQLRHPHIVQIIDSGQAADGSLYTVFAFAPGDNLADVLAAEGPLAPREARHLMLQVLDALACAHAQGIVHRDLKPSNLLIASTGARRNAIVLDFGISAILDGDPASGTRLTHSHETLGTPGYSAPEQARGTEPSPAADLFSWGLVFLECLTGTPVYRGASAAEISYQLLGPEPVPMPPAIARHPLGTLLRHATEKNPAARSASARDLLHALEACAVPAPSNDAWDSATASVEAARRGGGSPAPSVDDPTPPNGPASSVHRAGERRHLTVLCCQWYAGSSAADAETIDGVMRSLLALATEIVRRHRGYITSALGNHLLVYFGYPNAAEDDARRAARAALAIAEAVRAETDRLAPQGVAIETRLGLHAGPVLLADRPVAGVAREVEIAVGVTPHVAAELAASASPDTIVVSAESQRLLRGRFALAPAGSDVYALGPELEEMTPESIPEGARSPLVGRDQEIDLLVERWRHARAGMGHACLVTGEPGIGKSRLVRELRDRASADDHVFLEARCAPDTQHNALLPLADVLGRALGIDRFSDVPAKIGQLERQLDEYGLALADTMPLYLSLFSLPFTDAYPAPDVSPQRQKTLTLQAIASLVLAIAEIRPLLLVVEDLHWADATTLELITLLVRDPSSAPMSVLMTTRPELAPAFSTSGMLQLHLTRLDPAHVHAMVAGLVGDRSLPATVMEHVVNRTDGVPLFIEEMIRMMLESGWLLERDDRFELTGQPPNLEVPSTLRALLTARLDRLERAKQTAQLAAALGREFRTDVLAAASPLGPVAVDEDLERLMIAGLVLRKRRTKDPIAIFKHALVRDAAYDTLSRAAREEIHARITATLEERFPDIVRMRPDLLAQHHASAARYVEASRYAQLAAQQALQRSAHEAAIAHASNVLAWSEAFIADERVEVELAASGVLLQALLAARGWADSELKETVQRASALVRQLDGFSPHKVPVLSSVFMYHHVTGHLSEARSTAEELLAVAESSGDRGLQAAAYMNLGIALCIGGRVLDAVRVMERVIELYDPIIHRDHGWRFGHDPLVIAKTVLGVLRWVRGESELAFELVRSGLRWAREIGHVPSIALGLLYGSDVYQLVGDKQTTAEMAKEVLVLTEQYGLPGYEACAALMHAWALGEDDRAEAIIQILMKMEFKVCLSYYGSFVAQNLAERERYDAAIARIDQCLLLCEAHDERFYEPELHRLRAVYGLQRNPIDEPSVRASLTSAIRLAREYGTLQTEALANELLRKLDESNVPCT